MHWLVPVVCERLDFLVHQRFDFVCTRVADDDQATIVADEGHQILVGEQLRKGFEDLRFARVVEVTFDFAARLCPQFPHQRVEHAQHIEVVARLRDLVEHSLEERFAAILDGRHGVGDDEDPQRGAGDDDELIGLHHPCKG